MRSIAAQDVDQALSLIEDYPEISSIAMEGVVQQWASENLPAAIEFLRSNKDVASPQSISLVARNVLTQQGANALVNLYSSFEDPKFKESIAITAAGYFAKSHDMEGAVHWVDSIENGPRRRQAGVAAIRGMGFNNNMETHIQFIETSFGTNADSQTVYFQSLREWQKISPYKVIEYVDSLPPEANDLRAQLNWQLDLGLE